MASRRVVPTLFAALLLAVMSQSAWAQMSSLAQLYTVKPKADMAAGFQTALQQHVKWRAQNKDPWNWTTYEVVQGENLGSFVIRSGDHTWADFDAYDADFGPKGRVQYLASVAPLVESITASISALDTAHVRLPDDLSKITLLQVVTYYLKPDQGQRFNEVVGKFHSAIVKTDYPVYYAFVNQIAGGVGPAVTLVLPYENWAAFEGPDKPMAAMLAEVYGKKEAAKMSEEFSNCFTHVETSVLRFRPDLSVIAPGM
ncbi:MAG: hypothetical protein ACE5HT_11345 [Gemmatimonadales bacterium]